MEKSQGWDEKVNKLLKSKRTISLQLNEFNYSEAKPDGDKIGILQKNPNKNTKSGWEIGIEIQIRKMRQQAKLLSNMKPNEMKRHQKRQPHISQTIQLEEINQKGKNRDSKDTEIGSNNTNYFFQNNKRKIYQQVSGDDTKTNR